MPRDVDRYLYQPHRDSYGSMLTDAGLTRIRVAKTPAQVKEGFNQIIKGLISQNPHPSRVEENNQSKKGLPTPVIFED